MTSEDRGVPLGRYLLTERLAVGGMGEVYLALQRGLGAFEKPLALKLLLPHLGEDGRAVQMFLDEARLAARMNHPNIVQIFDVGLAEGRYYLAMELVRGVALSTLVGSLERGGESIPAPLVVYVARCLLSGLQHAHELVGPDQRPLHVIHRDVTPHNVLVSESGEVKLTDFGIAKTRDTHSRTAPGTLKGKFDYIAPEQARGDEPDQRADLYAAGITLFQLATLRSPFRRDSDVQTIQAVMSEPLPSLASARPDLPRELVELVSRLTAKSPRARPATAREALGLLPPPGPAEDPRALGERVRSACGRNLSRLEQQTRHALRLGETTGELAPSPEANTVENPLPTGELSDGRGQRGLGRRTSLPLVLGASLLGSFLAVGSVALLLSTPGQPPALAAAAPDEPAEAAEPPDEPNRAAPRLERDPGVIDAVAVAEPGPEKRRETVPAAAVVRAPVERARPPPLGYLTVDAVPWAKVSVAGKGIGETPIAKFPVERGAVTVVLHNPDTGKTVRRKVKVTTGRVTYVKEDLR